MNFSLKVGVVLKWMDTFFENITIVSLIVGLKMEWFFNWRGLKSKGPLELLVQNDSQTILVTIWHIDIWTHSLSPKLHGHFVSSGSCQLFCDCVNLPPNICLREFSMDGQCMLWPLTSRRSVATSSGICLTAECTVRKGSREVSF